MFAHSLRYNQSYRYSCVIQWYYYNKRWHHMNGYWLHTRQYLGRVEID